MTTKLLKILLIEDDRIEVLKLKRALNDENENYELNIVNNGEEALSYLKDNLVDVILLDLNMPNMNGIEFLDIIKTTAELKHIPVVILTTSNNNKDIYTCYKLGIAGYLIKPLKYDDYEIKIKAILNYWCLNEFLNL